MMNKMSGNELKIARIRSGLSQRELAAQVDAAENTVSRYETGRQIPSVAIIQKIAAVLDCDPMELFPDELRGQIAVSCPVPDEYDAPSEGAASWKH